MPDKNAHTGRFGGPGSAHQDREHPGKNHQDTGHKDGGGHPGSEKEHGKDVAAEEAGRHGHGRTKS